MNPLFFLVPLFLALASGRKGSAAAPAGIISVKGDASVVRGKRDWSNKKQYIEVHQTDYYGRSKPGGYAGIKTNLAIMDNNQVVEVHPIDEVVIGNYTDFAHIETSGVFYGIEGVESTLNRVVKDKKTGQVFIREPAVFTPAKEAALETAILHLVRGFRAHGIEPTLIFHSQTFDERPNDPGQAIAKATQRIARRYGLKLDPTFTRPGGVVVRREWLI